MRSLDEWRMYRRDLQETKEDLHILNVFVHRGISKVFVILACVTIINLLFVFLQEYCRHLGSFTQMTEQRHTCKYFTV